MDIQATDEDAGVGVDRLDGDVSALEEPGVVARAVAVVDAVPGAGVVGLVPNLPDMDGAFPAVDGGADKVEVVVEIAGLVPVPVGGVGVGGGPPRGGKEHAYHVDA